MIELAKYIGGAVAGYFGPLIAGSILELNSERIHSKEQLEKIVKEEAEALNLPYTIVPFLYEAEDKTIPGSRVKMFGFNLDTDKWLDFEEVDNDRIIPLVKLDIKKFKNGARRGTVRHELYHIAKHFPLGTGIKRLEWFYKEPAAVFYAITGKITV